VKPLSLGFRVIIDDFERVMTSKQMDVAYPAVVTLAGVEYRKAAILGQRFLRGGHAIAVVYPKNGGPPILLDDNSPTRNETTIVYDFRVKVVIYVKL